MTTVSSLTETAMLRQSSISKKAVVTTEAERTGRSIDMRFFMGRTERKQSNSAYG